MLTLVLTERGLQAGQNWWLSVWSEATATAAAEDPPAGINTTFYMLLYFGLGFTSLVFQVRGVCTCLYVCVCVVWCVAWWWMGVFVTQSAARLSLECGGPMRLPCIAACHPSTRCCYSLPCYCITQNMEPPNNPPPFAPLSSPQKQHPALHCLPQVVKAVMLVLGAVNAARVLQQRLLACVVRLPMSFFDSQPTGRLLNRFTKDTEAVDVALQGSVSSFINCAIR